MIDRLLWLLPAAILLTAAWRPRWSLYLFAAALPLFGSAPGGPQVTVATTSVLAVVLVAAVRGQRPEVSFRWSGLAAAIWLLVALASLAPWPSVPANDLRSFLRVLARLPLLHGHEPLFGWVVITNLVLGLLIGWAVLRLVPRNRLPNLALATSVGVVITVVLGVLARAELIDLWVYRPIPRSMDDPRFQSVWVDSRRLAEYLILTWPLALIWGNSDLSNRRHVRWFQGLFFGLVVLALVWSLQRGAWISLVVQLTALMIIYRAALLRVWRGLAGAAVVVVLLVALTPTIRDPFFDRATDLDDSSRVHYFQVSADLFLQRPALGWGVGSWATSYDLTADAHGGPIRGADTAHGLLTQIAAERGSIGLLAFALLVVVLGVRRLRPADAHGQPSQLDPAHVGVIISGLGLLAYGAFQYLPYLPALEWLLWMIAGMWLLATQESNWGRRAVVWLGMAIATVAVLFVPFQRRLAWQEPPRSGLFGWEGSIRKGAHRLPPTHRWTSDYAAVLLPRDGEWLSFSLIDGHPLRDEHRSSVRVSVNGQPLLEEEVPDSWHRCRLRVPSGSNPALVELIVEPPFRPFRVRPQAGDVADRSRDVRRLGLVLGNSCGDALCWDDPVARRKAHATGLGDANGCFPDRPKRPRVDDRFPSW